MYLTYTSKNELVFLKNKKKKKRERNWMVGWTPKSGENEGKDEVVTVLNLKLCSFHGFGKNDSMSISDNA